MADPTSARYRGLILSAVELQELNPNWPDRMIEDYLELLRFLFEVSDEVDVKNDIIKATTVVTFADTPYTPLATDEEIFFDTDGGDIDCTLPPGIDGTNYRLINSGSSGNKVIVTPALLELLYGVNSPENIYDYEDLIVTYETTEGWR